MSAYVLRTKVESLVVPFREERKMINKKDEILKLNHQIF